MTDSACIFCKIVDKSLPADIVSETDDLIAFKDINKAAPVHILVIPKEHVVSVNELQSANAHIFGKMALLAKDIAKELGIDESGYRLVVNTNADGGQTVYHLHMHLLGDRSMSWPPG